MTHPIFEIWNEEAPPEFPKATRLTASRLDKCKTRWGETPEAGYDQKMIYWIDLIRSCKTRPHLIGDNDRGWVMDFDYLTRNDTIHVQLSEGRFKVKPRPIKDDRPPYYNATPETRTVIGTCADCGEAVEGTPESAQVFEQGTSTCSACHIKSPEYRKSLPWGRSTP